jgi:hypothetical protein
MPVVRLCHAAKRLRSSSLIRNIPPTLALRECLQIMEGPLIRRVNKTIASRIEHYTASALIKHNWYQTIVTYLDIRTYVYRHNDSAVRSRFVSLTIIFLVKSFCGKAFDFCVS